MRTEQEQQSYSIYHAVKREDLKRGTSSWLAGSGQRTDSTWYRSRSDVVVNPKVNGWRSPSPYELTATQTVVGRTTVSVLQTHPLGYSFIDHADFPGAGSSWPQPYHSVSEAALNNALPPISAVDRSIIAARNNAADRKAGLLESLAESRQTLNFLSRKSAGLAQFVIALGRRDPAAMAKALGLRRRHKRAKKAEAAVKRSGWELSKAWLEYSFAITPLIKDLGVAVDYFNDRGEPRTYRVKGNATIPLGTSVTETPVSFTTNCSFKVAGTRRTTVSSGVYTSLWYEIASEDLRELTRYGFTDIPQVAWAVIPFSFVVDWVLPVSKVLRSLTATAGLRYMGGSSTRYVTISVDGEYHCVDAMNNSYYTMSAMGVPGAPAAKGMRMSRSVHKSQPNPVSLWIQDPFDAWKAVTSLALLGSVILNPKR